MAINTTSINVGEFHYSSGTVEGIPFTACTSNTDIIILASNFQRLQLISDPHNVPVSCIDCSTDVGKIAAAYGRRIVIYEPVPMISASNNQDNNTDTMDSKDQGRQGKLDRPSSTSSKLQMDYKWIHTATFEGDYSIGVISLNLEGTKLITGGRNLQMWHLLVYDQQSMDHLTSSISKSLTKSTNQQLVNNNNSNTDNHQPQQDEVKQIDSISSDGTDRGSNQPRPRGLSIVMQHLGIQQLPNHQSSQSNSSPANSFSPNDTQQQPSQPQLLSAQDKSYHRAVWQCVWRCLTANQVYYLKFSPDGTLFCSAGKSDRLVKIWYESVTKTPVVTSPNTLNPPTSPMGSRRPAPSLNPDRSSVNFSFIYIVHPRAVTGFSWRKTSKYTPRGSVANVLITSCQDNISRLWVQTLLPDDGLVNFGQLQGIREGDYDVRRSVGGAVRGVQTQRHRQKLLQRLKRMKAFSQFRKRQTLLDDPLEELEKAATDGNLPISSLPSTLSAHDFHSYAMCATAIIPGLHFHLAGSMDVDFDLSNNHGDSSSGQNSFTLNSSSRTTQAAGDSYSRSHFVIHWINNKESSITRSIEQLLHDMLMRILRASSRQQAGNASTANRESCTSSDNESDNDSNSADQMDLDTIDAESGKKLRHKLCHRINKQRAMAASGRNNDSETIDPNDPSSTVTESNRSSLAPTITTESANPSGNSPLSLVVEFDRYLDELLRKWQSSADLLFNINPLDGSLTIWQVHYLDGESPGLFRQVQIEQVSRTKSALPAYDSITVSIHMTAYSQSTYQDVKRAYLAVTGAVAHEPPTPPAPAIPSLDSLSLASSTIDEDGANIGQAPTHAPQTSSDPNLFIVTQHLSGTIGLWKLNFEANYPHVQSVDLVTRITGLPMHSSWLRDGILILDYDYKTNSIVTEWRFIDTNGKPVKDNKPSLITRRSTENQNQSQLTRLPHVAEEEAPETDDDQTDNSASHNCESVCDVNELLREEISASRFAQYRMVLPQYHVKQLIELLAFGRLPRVKAILNHLVNCLAASEPQASSNIDLDTTSVSGPWGAHRSRTLSIVAQSPPVFHDSFDFADSGQQVQQQVIEEIELDYTEVTSIRALPLHCVLEADNEKPHKDASKPISSDEFSIGYDSFMRSRSTVEETIDEILGQSTLDTLNRKTLEAQQKHQDGRGPLASFGPRKAKMLTKMLTHIHLPGLTNLDQMHLLAVADAVASFDATADDYADLGSHEDQTHSQRTIAIDSLDDCGLRFLLGMLQHIYLTKCLPMQPRQALRAAGIGSKNIIWAFHSETQDELISLIPCVQRNKPTWSELAEYGVGWWVRKIEVLRKLMEKVAQCAYQLKSDPLDAALYYLAMKKKTLVCALLRRVNCDKRLLKLFEQDFTDPVNRKKALKNAYALLGLHRYEHAAAFFILAGSIWDAVEVCLNKMNDIQLAIVLIRLHDSDVDVNVPSNLRKVLYLEILGGLPADTPSDIQQDTSNAKQELAQSTSIDSTTSNTKADSQFTYNLEKASRDSFLRSMAMWILGNYLQSVGTLLDDVQSVNPKNALDERTNTDNESGVDSAVFNFYLYLRERPIIVRRRQSIVDEHEQLFFSTANSYLRDGCPLLALEVLSRVFDKRAQQLKFIACAHLLLDELNTLAVGCTDFDRPNTQMKLRNQLYEWLEKSVKALTSVSNYRGRPGIVSPNIDESNVENMVDNSIFATDDSRIAIPPSPNSDHEELVLAGPERLDWLKSNEPLLRTMLTYCNLHGATDQNLFTVRHELMQLLNDLDS